MSRGSDNIGMGTEFFTIALVGPEGAGKSSLLFQYVTLKQLPRSERPSLTSDNLTLSMIPPEKDKENAKKLLVYDFPKQMGDSTLYCAKFDGFVLVFDVNDMESFRTTSVFVEKLRQLDAKKPIILVGNKTDGEGREVSFAEARAFAERYRLKAYTETSAKTNEGVKNLFSPLYSALLLKPVLFTQENAKKSQSPEDVLKSLIEKLTAYKVEIDGYNKNYAASFSFYSEGCTQNRREYYIIAEQLLANLQALKYTMDTDILGKIREIFGDISSTERRFSETFFDSDTPTKRWFSEKFFNKNNHVIGGKLREIIAYAEKSTNHVSYADEGALASFTK